MTTNTAPPAGRPSRRRLWLTFAAILLAALPSALDQTVIATAVWPIARDLDPVSGVRDLPWAITLFALTATVIQPLCGKLCDIFGAKRVYLLAVTAFLAGSLLCGFAQNMGQFIAFRAIQGFGAGALYVVMLVVIGLMVSPRERGAFQGAGGVLIVFATVLGPLAGGLLADSHHVLGLTTSWRWIFLLNVPLCGIALVLIALLLRVPYERREHRIDWSGTVLVVAGISALLLVTEWGGERYAWNSGTILGLGAVAVVLLAAFVWRQSRAAEPIMPASFWRIPAYRVATPMLFLLGAALMGGSVYVQVYLQVSHGLSATQAGLYAIPMGVGLMITSILSGGLVTKWGRYKIFPILGSIVTAVAFGLLTTISTTTPVWQLIVLNLVFGMGIGLFMQILILVIQNSVRIQELATATTSAIFFRTIGQAMGTAVFGAVIAAQTGTSTAPGVFVAGTRMVFAIAAGVMVLSLILAFLLKEMRLQEYDDIAILGDEARWGARKEVRLPDPVRGADTPDPEVTGR